MAALNVGSLVKLVMNADHCLSFVSHLVVFFDCDFEAANGFISEHFIFSFSNHECFVTHYAMIWFANVVVLVVYRNVSRGDGSPRNFSRVVVWCKQLYGTYFERIYPFILSTQSLDGLL